MDEAGKSAHYFFENIKNNKNTKKSLLADYASINN
jgi:hypothetical protein